MLKRFRALLWAGFSAGLTVTAGCIDPASPSSPRAGGSPGGESPGGGLFPYSPGAGEESELKDGRSESERGGMALAMERWFFAQRAKRGSAPLEQDAYDKAMVQWRALSRVTPRQIGGPAPAARLRAPSMSGEGTLQLGPSSSLN